MTSYQTEKPETDRAPTNSFPSTSSTAPSTPPYSTSEIINQTLKNLTHLHNLEELPAPTFKQVQGGIAIKFPNYFSQNRR
jgi:hypothetical protein